MPIEIVFDQGFKDNRPYAKSNFSGEGVDRHWLLYVLRQERFSNVEAFSEVEWKREDSGGKHVTKSGLMRPPCYTMCQRYHTSANASGIVGVSA